MNIYKQTKLMMDDLQRKEDQYIRECLRKCDWKNPEDVAEYRADLRSKRRTVILPKDRKCPLCGKLKVSSRQWVARQKKFSYDDDDDEQIFKRYFPDREYVRELQEAKKPTTICRSCYHRQLITQATAITLDVDIFTLAEVRYHIDGEKIRQARQGSLREFAKKIGWNHSYQKKLEDGGVLTLNELSCRDLSEALESDEFILAMEPRYSLNINNFKVARSRGGLSQNEFARRAEWSDKYQRNVENGGESTTFGHPFAEKVLQILKDQDITTNDHLETN
jgi:transcriptional regulator with XRE-family HTH domain